MSVCPQGRCLPHCMLGYTPLGPEADTPQADTPRQTPPRQTPPHPVHAGIHPPAQCMLGYTPPLPSAYCDTHTPPVQCMLGYGQQAGSTHPTGMHSCFIMIPKQECIPVGCIPTAHRPYARVCFPGGCLVRRCGGRPGLVGWCAWSGGWCAWSGGHAWSGGVCLVWGSGVPGPGGGGRLLRGVCLSALWDTTTPPVNRMTNRCKNITLATTSLRPVITRSNLQV